jgi:glycosyltransferase involved in cell wall biosynthesis
MRILSVSALVDPQIGGGTAERTMQLARAMARAGFDVTVLATKAGLASKAPPEAGSARLELLPLANERFLLPRVDRPALENMVGRADVVHLCNHWTLLNLIVQRAARRQRKPYVICPAGGLPIFGRSQWLKRAYNALGGRALVAQASAWVAITQRETEDFRPYGVDPSAVDVIPNGIEPRDYREGDPAAFRTLHGLQERKLVLFMGRLNAIKGPDLLLDAFAAQANALPQHTLVYAGPDGGLRAALEERARSAGLADRVRFVGWLGGRDKVAAYRAAELVVIPSRQEAMSLVALEAGACAKAVLMTDRCGFDSAISAGAAVAVPPDAASLATALRALLAGDRLEELGARLCDLVLRDYAWDVAVRRYAALFSRITAARA